MATPAMSCCSTDALSSAPVADSDDEADGQSPMWVQEADRACSDLPADLQAQSFSDLAAGVEAQAFSDLPADFLEPLSPDGVPPLPPFPNGSAADGPQPAAGPEARQFWKSGDFAASFQGTSFATDGLDHARVHPRFLHSNATSHKWVLGAVAELLDNSVDEIRNGATSVKIDVQPNPRNGEPMLVIEDDGGGMDPDCMRRCMSLGYSAKSKIGGTIGQYGNGFKTSTMRLGADVVVFSRSQRNKASESVGMMSYTFLTSTGQNDIVVPIVDFQIEAFGIRKLIRSNADDWMESMQAIQDWSPFSSQAELVSQFRSMPHRQGTKVVIYNLWEDEEGHLELDFDADPHDIQIRATSRDKKVLQFAAQFPSCKHYLTYKHSLRTYVSILYLHLPAKFKILLRGTEVPHHCLTKEMMLVEQVTYRPKDSKHSKAVVTLGFVKDAKEHIDISGFNVYHKNRLIKPFWRIWNISGTQGRGIIGILEANFVEPAHDKQGFERTIVLTRLEARLIEMQKNYWNKNCHMIGYANPVLKKAGRRHLKDSKPLAKVGITESRATDGGGATMCADTEHVRAKQAIQAAHDNNIASEFSDALGGLPAAIVQTQQEASATSSITEMEKQNLLPIAMASNLDGAAKIDEILSFRQDPIQVEPSLAISQSVEDSHVDSLRKLVLNATSNHVDLNSQESRTSCMTGITPVIIDLDPPDVDSKCQFTDFGMHSPQNIDHHGEILSEKNYLKLADARNVFGNSGWSGATAELSTKNESQKLIDSSICLPQPGDKVLPEAFVLKSCSKKDSIGKHHREARTEEPCIESLIESNDLVTTTAGLCVAAPMALVKECEEVELEPLERCIVAPNVLGEGCKQAEHETPERTVLPTTVELDDNFDSLEGPPTSSPSIKDTEIFIEIEMILSDQEENGALNLPLSNSADVHGGNENASVRIEDVITKQENMNIIMAQVDCVNVLKESVPTSLLSESAINVLPHVDEVMVDVNGQERDEPVEIANDTRSDPEREEHQQMDEHMSVVLQDDTDPHDQNNSCMSIMEPQEHENMAASRDHDQEDSLTAALDHHKDENMALVPHNGATLHDRNDFQGSAEVPCLDIVSVPTIAMADIVVGSIANNLSSDLLKEERLVAAKQQIDYLQQSIEVIVLEVDDLKEQLQQERELQQKELTNLHVELERALSRLEGLRV